MKRAIYFLIFTLLVSFSAYSQGTITFDDQGYTDGQNLGTSFSLTNNSQSFTISSTSDVFYESPGSCYTANGFLGTSETFSATTTISITTTDGSFLKINSLELINELSCQFGGLPMAFNITGYANGELVNGASFDLASTTDLIRIANLPIGFDGVDEIRIVATSVIAIASIDNIVWSEPTVPTASDFSVATALNTPYIFATDQFGYSDPNSDPLDHIRITTIPTTGTLYLDADGDDNLTSGEELADGSMVGLTDLDAGNLQYISPIIGGDTFVFDVTDGTNYSHATYTAFILVGSVITFDDLSLTDNQDLGSFFPLVNGGQSFVTTVTISMSYQNTGECYSASGFISSDMGISIQTADNALIYFASLDLIFDETCTIGGAEGFIVQAFKSGVQIGSDQILVATADVSRTLSLSTDFLCVDQLKIFPTNGSGLQIGIDNVLWIAKNAPIAPDAMFAVNEYGTTGDGVTNGTSVGTVVATDADLEALTYTITNGNTEDAFAINASTGEITVADETVLDFEVIPAYTLTVDVADGCQSATATITVNVNDLSPNDFCTDAITIGVGVTVSGSTLDATNDTAIAPDCGSNLVEEDESVGVWYHLVGTGEKITLSTCDDADYDTGIGVYAGSCTNGLTCIAGNDDGTNCSDNTSELSFISIQDQDYFILIDGYSSEYGNFNLTTSGVPAPTPPANDNCSEAELLTVFAEGTGMATDGDNTNATSFTEVVFCDRFAEINDVWYTFNSGLNVEVAVSIELVDTDGAGSGVAAGEVSYEVYANCGEEGLEECGSDGTSVFSVTPNTDYRLQLWNSPSDEGTFTILINDGPNTAASVGTSTVSMSRYSLNGDIAETVIVTDTEGHDQVLFITAGNGEGIFAIDPTTGEITVVDETSLLASATTSFVLTVEAADQGPGALTSTGTVTINIIDNQFPVIGDQTISIDENSANATVVVNVNATDPDTDNLAYAILSGNTGTAFSIDALGEITVNDQAQLDFETTPTFTLEVEVTDDGPLTLASTATITITLNDLNEAPVVADASFGISQNNTNGYSIGLVDFTDEDTGQGHTYGITAGNTNTIFAIIAVTGQLFVANQTDLLGNGAAVYTLTVEVTDDGAPVQAGSATVTVNVFANNPPVITPVAFNPDENLANASVIGSVIATDPESDGITFTIISGNDLGGFLITPAGEIQVADITQLDFETNPSFNLEIQAQDDGAGLLSDVEFVGISLNEINESPIPGNSGFTQNFNIGSSAANGTALGTVDASDPENDVITYSITAGNGAGIFAINSITGELLVADGSLLNPATVPIHSLTIGIADAALSSSALADIYVYANQYPTLSSTSFNVDENSADGTLITTLSSSDADGIELFEIVSGNDLGEFAIDGATGDLTINMSSAFDAETTQQFDIGIRMTDLGLGNLQNTETINIVINDVNEFAPVMDNISDVTIDAGLAVAFTATATDADLTNAHSYSLDAASVALGMSINSSTGAFDWTPAISDYGTTVNPTVTVTDGSLEGQQVFAISVTKGNQSIIFNTLSAVSYGDADFNFTATASSSLMVTYSSSDLTVATVSGSTLTIVGAGTASITASQTGDANYAAATDVPQNLVVNQSILTITGNDAAIIYADAIPALDVLYSGFENGEDATVLTTAPTAVTSATATSNAGTYAITSSGGADDNYSFTYVDGTLTISQAILTVTANDAAISYADAIPALDVLYSGFQNGEDAAALTTVPTASTLATVTSNVGSYAITASGGVADNYSFTYVDGTLTIDKASLTAIADDQSKTYGASNPTLTISYTGYENSEDATVLDTAPAAATSADATSDAGNYTVTASGGVADNYSFTYVDGTLTINKAGLTATADNQAINEGDALPTFTIAYSGFVNGEDDGVLDTAPDASVSVLDSSEPGTFDIILSGGLDNNYSFTLMNGTLTIEAVLGLTDQHGISLKLYPNPVANSFRLVNAELKIQQVMIYDLNGTLVKHFTRPQQNYDITNLSQGIYTLVLTSADQVYFQKMIKK